MGCISSQLRDVQSVVVMVLPAVSYLALDGAYVAVMLVCLGYLGKGELAAGLLGVSYVNMLTSFLEGGLIGVDAQLQGASRDGKHALARYWTFAALTSSLFTCSVGTLLMLLSAFFIPSMSGTNGHTTGKAIEFVIMSIPALWLTSLTGVVHRYNFSRGRTADDKKTLFLGLGIQVTMLGMLMFGLGMGFMGSYIATLASRSFVAFRTFRQLLREKRFRTEVADLASCGLAIVRRRLGLLARVRMDDEAYENVTLHFDGGTEGLEVNDISLRGAEKLTSSQTKENLFEGVGAGIMLSPIHRAGRQDNALMQEMTPTSSLNNMQHGDVGGGAEGEEGETALEEPDEQQALQEARVHELVSYCCRLFYVGGSGSVFVSVDLWFLDAILFLSSFLGNVAFCATAVLVVIARLAVRVVCMPLSNALATKVQVLLRQGKLDQVIMLSRATTFLALAPPAMLACVVYLARGVLPRILTSDQDVVDRFSNIALHGSVFLCVFLSRYAYMGLLRGTHRFVDCAGYSLLCEWLMGLGTGYYLCFRSRPRFGLPGLWIGLVVGSLGMLLILAAVIMVLDWGGEERRFALTQQRAREDADSAPLLAAPWSLGVGALPLSTLLLYSDEKAAMDELEFIEYGNAQYNELPIDEAHGTGGRDNDSDNDAD
jgi:Na+-driven multidrug efflux pump